MIHVGKIFNCRMSFKMLLSIVPHNCWEGTWNTAVIKQLSRWRCRKITIINENLFRVIFATQIHIQIHIRYFKSSPIVTYYLTTIQIKSLYLQSKRYNMGLKWNLYLTSLSRRGPAYPSTSIFGNINLTEKITNSIFAWKFSQKRTKESLFAT